MAFSLKKQSKQANGAAKPIRPVAKKTKDKKRPVNTSAAKESGRARRFVFILGDEGCILVLMQGRKVVRRLFAPSAQPSHTEAIREIMQANASVPVYLLVDVLDQQYIPHPFPPVSALTVGSLVKRRLDRDFQPEDLKGALPLGRDKTGRKEWKYLLIGLTKTPLVSEWLDLISNLPNEMKGVYLVPVEAVSYIAQLNKVSGNEKPKPWQLFISHNKVSGFRQVVLHEGRLVFTRVSQAIDDAIPAVIAGNVEQEIINTMEYLKRLDFKENGELDAMVIISQDVRDSLDLNRFGFARAGVMTPLDVSEALGLEQAALSADRFGDVVMASAFGVSKKRVLRLATAYIDQLAKLHKAKVAIKAAAILLVLVLLGLTAQSLVGIVGNQSAISEVEGKLARLSKDLQQAQKRVDGLNKDVAFQSAVVAAHDSYVKDAPKPKDIMKLLMQFVSSKARITEISWNYLEPGAPTPMGVTLPTGVSLPTSAQAGKPGVMVVDVKFDISAAAEESDPLTAAANALFNEMKTKLSAYDVSAEPYPWIEAAKKASSTELLSQTSTIRVEDRVVKFKIYGPKPGQGKP